MEADEDACRRHVENATASATALVPIIGYARSVELVGLARAEGTGLRVTAVGKGYVTAEQFDACTSAEAVSRLGFGSPRPASERETR
jgi:aspartate ammonia-lyase